MSRKKITEIFPFLIPFRKSEKKFFFYTKMKFDGERYSETHLNNQLSFKLFEASSNMYNQQTGFDMAYQENKVHNLKSVSYTHLFSILNLLAYTWKH